MKAPDEVQFEKAEAALDQASDLIQFITQATLLTGWLSHSSQAMEAKA